MKLFFILGNQLFPLKYVDRFKKDHSFYMAEDYELCTYEKHHKQKILLFLSSMRSYADMLKVNKYKVEYSKIEDKDFKDTYFKKLKTIIDQKKITEISSFEVEDKFFEKKISQFLKKEKRRNVPIFKVHFLLFFMNDLDISYDFYVVTLVFYATFSLSTNGNPILVLNFCLSLIYATAQRIYLHFILSYACS